MPPPLFSGNLSKGSSSTSTITMKTVLADRTSISPTTLSARWTCRSDAPTIRHNAQVSDGSGKKFYASITSLPHTTSYSRFDAETGRRNTKTPKTTLKLNDILDSAKRDLCWECSAKYSMPLGANALNIRISAFAVKTIAPSEKTSRIVQKKEAI